MGYPIRGLPGTGRRSIFGQLEAQDTPARLDTKHSCGSLVPSRQNLVRHEGQVSVHAVA